MLEVARDHFKIPPERMFQEIQFLRQAVEDVLVSKGISYDALKSALVPDSKRKEIALIFNPAAITEGWYGLAVFRRVFPLFSPESNHSVLEGDYGGYGENYEAMLDAMYDAVNFVRPLQFENAPYPYVIYINNLSDAMFEKFRDGLVDWDGYVGYADTTYASMFKTALSTMLSNTFIKHRRIIIQGHEDDRPNSEDVNMIGYPFEDYGYTCKSIQSQLEGTLLSYKIERPVFPGFEVDTEFSLNAISPNPRPLDDFRIEVEEAKLDYVKREKSESIKKVGLEAVTSLELSEIIKSKISASYIYNMSFIEKHNVSKFNIIIEIQNEDFVRLLAALEYKPDKKILRLVTLY